MELQEKIEQFLKDSDRTPTWFAKQCNLSQATVSRIVRGTQRNLTDETKRRIERVIDGLPLEEEKNKDIQAGETINRLLGIIERQQDEISRLTQTIIQLSTRGERL